LVVIPAIKCWAADDNGDCSIDNGLQFYLRLYYGGFLNYTYFWFLFCNYKNYCLL